MIPLSLRVVGRILMSLTIPIEIGKRINARKVTKETLKAERTPLFPCRQTLCLRWIEDRKRLMGIIKVHVQNLLLRRLIKIL